MAKYESSLDGDKIQRVFDTRELARVADRRLQALYIKHGLRPVDVYPSIDDNGRDIVVMMFLKEESNKYYKMWMDRTLK